MKHYFLKNIFNEDDRVLLDCAVRGMHYANRSEVHAGQNSEAYGSFSEALHRIVTICYGKPAAEALYSRYNFDCTDGEEWLAWFDECVKEDSREMTDMLAEATIEV